MKKFILFKSTLLCAALLTLSAVRAQTISQADYAAGKSRIAATYKADKTACGSLTGNAKDICKEEAKAKEKVARAELEYNHTGKAADRKKVLVVKAKSDYAVAKERCDDQTGKNKDVCVQEARTVEKKALAEARLSKESSDTKKDAATEKLDTDYKAAIEKCDALAGDAKSSCIAAAKVRFGKN